MAQGDVLTTEGKRVVLRGPHPWAGAGGRVLERRDNDAEVSGFEYRVRLYSGAITYATESEVKIIDP